MQHVVGQSRGRVNHIFKNSKTGLFFVTSKINARTITMEMDKGSPFTVLNKSICEQIGFPVKIHAYFTILQTKPKK